jgi:spermidine/putrescine transport system ATP-binding protein
LGAEIHLDLWLSLPIGIVGYRGGRLDPRISLSSTSGRNRGATIAGEHMFIRLSNVSKSFGDSVVLNNVSLDINTGEFHTLLGPSGCGKTTLLRLIAGFESLTAGQILLDGEDIAGRPPRQRPVNTVFQSYALFPHMSVTENIGFGLRMLRWTRARIDDRVQAMLELVRLSPYANRLTSHLSGGQQQRVALARALAPEPKALLLDEPLSALDFQLRKSMQSELKQLHTKTGITFILVTHDREEALALSDRISIIDAGRIAQVGTPAEVYLSPSTRFVASFVSNANLVPLDDPSLTRALAIRPERIQLVDPTRGRFKATVIDADFVGDDTIVRLQLKNGPEIIARVPGPNVHRPLDEVGIDWRDSDAVTVDQ